MHPDVQEVLVSKEDIEKRCRELGQIISQDYAGQSLILIGLLKGSIPFLAELMKHIELELEIDFMDVSSYIGTQSHEVRIVKDLTTAVTHKAVLIVEDIVDTGKTLRVVMDLLDSRNAQSVKVATLLDKPANRLVEIEADYVGFTIPPKFVIGFGLDFDEKYRNLPYVGVLKESLYR